MTAETAKLLLSEFLSLRQYCEVVLDDNSRWIFMPLTLQDRDGTWVAVGLEYVEDTLTEIPAAFRLDFVQSIRALESQPRPVDVD